jgi:2,3-bisphosphoglycerate-independent phosphoglycerate mutase
MTGHRLPGGNAIAETIKSMYREGQTDYALEPIILVDQLGTPIGCVEDGDAVVFCCRRGEREIQLTDAFTDPGFKHFRRREFHQLDFVLLTLYHEKFKDLPVAFAPSKVDDTLGEVVSQAGLRQLRVAESEKFAHITFFFNGWNNQPFPGEEDIFIPSPKGIAFDQIPELSLPHVAQQVIQAISHRYDLIVANFANGDVIGHTSNPMAKIRCAEVVDENLGVVVQAALASDYVVLVTADHGNLEEMTQADGSPHVAHTSNQVPFVIIDPRGLAHPSLRDGMLADIAPTILSVLGLDKPPSMTGVTLLPGQDWEGQRRVLLVILDGWGLGRQDGCNPIYLARTPVWDELMTRHNWSRLDAAGMAVGLKEEKPGNSEAGHMNIGAGRIVLQDDVRLDLAMQDGTFFSNEVLRQAISDVKRRNTNAAPDRPSFPDKLSW